MLVLDAQGPSVVFQPAQLPFPELALTARFAALLLGPIGNANGPQIVPVPVQITGEPRAEFARVQAVVLAPSFQAQAHGRGDQGLRPRRHQFFMQRVTKAAALIDRVHSVPGGDLLAHPSDKLSTGEFLRQRDRALVTLDGGDDKVQVHIQAQLEDLPECGVALSPILSCSVHVMNGFEVEVYFHQECGPVWPAHSNPSWHLTAPRWAARPHRNTNTLKWLTTQNLKTCRRADGF